MLRGTGGRAMPESESAQVRRALSIALGLQRTSARIGVAMIALGGAGWLFSLLRPPPGGWQAVLYYAAGMLGLGACCYVGLLGHGALLRIHQAYSAARLAQLAEFLAAWHGKPVPPSLSRRMEHDASAWLVDLNNTLSKVLSTLFDDSASDAYALYLAGCLQLRRPAFHPGWVVAEGLIWLGVLPGFVCWVVCRNPGIAGAAVGAQFPPGFIPLVAELCAGIFLAANLAQARLSGLLSACLADPAMLHCLARAEHRRRRLETRRHKAWRTFTELDDGGTPPGWEDAAESEDAYKQR